MSEINHPSHYTHETMECIDEMITVFGVKSTIDFCILNAWKYRYRAGKKDDENADRQKANWYLAKARELRDLQVLPRH